MLNKAKKILLVVNTLTLGGAEAQALIMARALKKNTAYIPVIVGLTSGGPLETILQSEQIDFMVVGVNFNHFNKNWRGKIGELLRAVRLFKQQQPHIILSSTYYPNIFTAICSLFLFKTHFYWYQVGKEWGMPVSTLQKLAQKLTKNFLANSHDVKSYMIDRLKIKSEKIQVITNVFLERTSVHNQDFWRKKLSLREEDFTFMLVSNFFKSKDQLTGILAMPKVLSRFPNAKLVLAGFPPEPNFLNSIKAAVIDLKLYNNVFFIDSTPDIFGLLSVANASIFTSVKQHTEGSPTIIQEYMFAGLPTIVSHIPCNLETFEGINTALFYEPENPDSLAEQMIFLLENPSFCTEAGKNNQHKAKLAFTPEVLVNQLLPIFKD